MSGAHISIRGSVRGPAGRVVRRVGAKLVGHGVVVRTAVRASLRRKVGGVGIGARLGEGIGLAELESVAAVVAVRARVAPCLIEALLACAFAVGRLVIALSLALGDLIA